MSCLFQLDHYQIESVLVAQNEEFDSSADTHTGDIAGVTRITPHKSDPCKYLLGLEIEVNPKPQREKEFFPYYVAIKGSAFFSFKELCSKEVVERYLHLNGASILYGLLRAQVAQITAQSAHGQFLLPTVNFVAVNESNVADADDKPAEARPKDTAPDNCADSVSTPSSQCVREKASAYPQPRKSKRPSKRGRT